MTIKAYKGLSPKIDKNAIILEGSVISGDVTIGPYASVWYNATVRGDMGPVTIGARSNIQEGAIIHESIDRTPTMIEEDVTVGHGAIIHGAIIRRECLIGMGAIILDDAEIGPRCIIGAGALVPEHMKVPEGHLALGVPARVIRPLTDEEKDSIMLNSRYYVVEAVEHSEQK